jgi:carotenoid cleavage dioxygenase
MLADLLRALDKHRPRPPIPDLPNPYLEGNYAPVGREGDFAGLAPRLGRIPDGFAGTLYRMSPAPRFEPISRTLYHWFDGDGMIDAFQFADGSVHHRNRWVRTPKLELEEAAGRSLFGGIRDFGLSTPFAGLLALGLSPVEILGMPLRSKLGLPPSRDQFLRVLCAMNRSNTNIQLLAGRLLALVEGSPAHEIDPQTLSTRGEFDFGGALIRENGGMVAHPKVDAQTGTLYTFAYWLDRPGLTYYVFDRSGSCRLRRDVPTPYTAMMHDFSVTETRAVFYHLPAVLHMSEFDNPNSVRWQPSRGSRIGVLPRDHSDGRMRWYEIPACYIFHPLNAFDDGESVVLDVVKYSRLPLFDAGGENPNPPVYEYAPGQLVRMRLDLSTGTLREQLISEHPCEFPVVDPRFALRRHRHGWLAARRGQICGRGALNALLHVDFGSGQERSRILGPSSYVNEALFVPRTATSQEGDGYLITTVFHADSGQSELLLLDAQNIDGEPVAIIPTRQRVPFGFHGTWVPA